MGKGKTRETASSVKQPAAVSELKFPHITPKKHLALECVIPSQIYVLDGFLSDGECEKWVEWGKGLVMEGPKPPGKDEAERTNSMLYASRSIPNTVPHEVFGDSLVRSIRKDRFQTYAPTFAQTLYTALAPHLPASIFGSHAALYPKIRIYEYPPGTFFARHYDDSTLDALTGLRSRWTVLIYLTTPVGGVTRFWTREPNARGKGGESVAVECVRGRAVMHLHGDECLVHEGEVVTRGDKWVLRSDLMYR